MDAPGGAGGARGDGFLSDVDHVCFTGGGEVGEFGFGRWIGSGRLGRVCSCLEEGWG